MMLRAAFLSTLVSVAACKDDVSEPAKGASDPTKESSEPSTDLSKESSDASVEASTSSSACDALASAARSEVGKALEGNQACSDDKDCIAVEFAADCFDSCSRTTNTSGVAAVDAAKASVNAAQCKQFQEQGCKVERPPCAPPNPPRCSQGLCI